jgi:hypothetical protein
VLARRLVGRGQAQLNHDRRCGCCQIRRTAIATPGIMMVVHEGVSAASMARAGIVTIAPVCCRCAYTLAHMACARTRHGTHANNDGSRCSNRTSSDEDTSWLCTICSASTDRESEPPKSSPEQCAPQTSWPRPVPAPAPSASAGAALQPVLEWARRRRRPPWQKASCSSAGAASCC